MRRRSFLRILFFYRMVVYLFFLLSIALLHAAKEADDHATLNPRSQLGQIDVKALILGSVLGLGGFLFLFFGSRLVKPTLFLTGLAVGGILSYVTLQQLSSKYDLGPHRSIIVIVCPLLTGVLGGILFLCVSKLGQLAIGGLGGFTIGLFILIWCPLSTPIQSATYRPIFISILAILGTLLMTFFEKTMLILCTSLFGAGAMCCAVDVFAETGFLHTLEALITNLMSEEDAFFGLNEKVLGLLISYIIVTGLGLFIQFRFSYTHSNQSFSKQRPTASEFTLPTHIQPSYSSAPLCICPSHSSS